MIRIKCGTITKKRRKKYLDLAKGYTGSNRNLSTFAKEQVIQSLNFIYIERRFKKRKFRKIWIYRINIVTRIINNNYSNFMGSMRKLNIFLNKKILSFLAYNDLVSFIFLERNL